MLAGIAPLLLLSASLVAAIEVPAGLRPAKAVGDDEDRVVPKLDEETAGPANARIPPNLSLRSRLVVAQNSRTSASLDEEVVRQQVDADFQQPMVFTKSKTTKKPAFKAGETAAPLQIPRVTRPPAPRGNYGVNTLLQTNLVDSRGRIIKGVSSVPIRVPSTDELKASKPTQASARQVDTEAERVVPIEFGSAHRAI